MAMKCRTYYVIYCTYKCKDGTEEDRYHSRTSDMHESSKILDALLKAGVRAYCRKEYE